MTSSTEKEEAVNVVGTLTVEGIVGDNEEQVDGDELTSNNADAPNEEQLEEVKNEEENNEVAGENSSDDFGNFSDASFENEVEEEDDNLVESCLNKIFPKEEISKSSKNVSNNSANTLESLLKGGRPAVIYEQLVQLKTVLHPFVWNKSDMKSTLLHILKIDDKVNSNENIIQQEPLDDKLYTRLIISLVGNTSPSNTTLCDVFKYKYVPHLAHKSLVSEDEAQLEAAIPDIISTDIHTLEAESAASELQRYHDDVCNAIDLLYVQLKILNKRQSDLIRDKATFENVVTNLTSHTQRLHRDEIAYYKKSKKKNKFSWIGR